MRPPNGLIVGVEALRQARLDPSRFEPNPKRRIDDGEVLLGESVVPVVDVIAAVLRAAAAEARRQLGGVSPGLVRLTHPAGWGSSRRNTLLSAARLAGLGNNVELIAEPVAAAAQFTRLPGRELAPGRAVAIYDLGGGTFDAAVVGRDGDDFFVLAEAGLPDLGGLDFDQTILDHVGRVASAVDPARWQALIRPVDPTGRRAARALAEDLRAAKETLSDYAQTSVALPEPFTDALLTRAEFEGLIRAKVERTVDVLSRALAGAGVGKDALADVFLVGGSSRIPLVARTIFDRLGVIPVALDQPETAVALGALAAPHARGSAVRTEHIADADADADPASLAPQERLPGEPVRRSEPDRQDMAGQPGVPGVRGAPAQAPPEPQSRHAARPPRRRARRRRARVITATALVVVVAIVLTIVLINQGSSRTDTAGGPSGNSGSSVAASSLPSSSGPAPHGDVAATTAGLLYECALLSGGTVSCWGRNDSGQLGDGTTVDRSSPVAVSGLSGVTAVAAGDDHMCALHYGGTLSCRGSNGSGQLGDGTTVDRSSPVAVSGLTGVTVVTAVTAGSNHTCALLSGGTVSCWGLNDSGQLGDGTTTERSSPVAVSGLTGVTALAAGGNHTCALLSDGTVSCWGGGPARHFPYAGPQPMPEKGLSGVGTTANPRPPVVVDGLTGVTAISADGDDSCALLRGGTVSCWSELSVQRGDGTTATGRSSPVAVSGLTSVTAVAAGGDHNCALLSGGTISCWGSNDSGQLGDGTTTSRPTPVAVSGLTSATAVTAGSSHTCALLTNGISCWGYNRFGQLGDNSTIDRLTPVPVTGL